MKKEKPLAISAATDGACSGNPGPGGWGALIKFDDGSLEEFGGSEEATTNNRMELKAALKTLERLKEIPRQKDLEIKTDSKYLINGLSSWIKNWKKKGWITSNGKPVLNKDLWEALDSAQLKGVKLIYVKGHSGEADNERVDKIAVSFARGESISLNCRQELLLSNKEDYSLKKNTYMKKSNSDEAKIQNLLSKLELVERFAKGGYRLNSLELAILIDVKIKELETKTEKFQWRDWLIKPVKNGYWRIEKYEE